MLDAIVDSAVRVCGIDDVVIAPSRREYISILRAHFGPIPIGRAEISIDEPQIRWIREHGTLHIPDVRVAKRFPYGGFRHRLRALSCSSHFVSSGNSLGSLAARRIEVHPFTPAQIKLLETFADQAVIAIENVRLFQELEARTQRAGSISGGTQGVGRSRPSSQLHS